MKSKLQSCRILLSALMLACSWATALAQAPTSIVVNNTNCTTPNGKITFTAPTPTGNFLFSINNGATFGAINQVEFTGLFGGTYATVSKNIATGVVSGAVSKVLTNPTTGDAVSAVAANTSCISPNGKITFTGPIPLASYEFSVDGGVTFHPAGDPSFATLTGGVYATYARNIATTCISDVVNKTITSPVVAAPTSTVAPVTNCTTPNGSITFTAPTPTGNYVFSIDGGNTYGAANQTAFTSLSAGSYATKAKLVSSGCESAAVTKTVTATAVGAPVSTLVNNTSCSVPNGKITFTGPTPLANYIFSLDGGVTFGAPNQVVFSGKTGGTYQTVAKLVSTGCVSAKVAKTLTNPTVGAPVSTVTPSTSCSSPTGKIAFTGPTPIANYQFSIDGGATFHAAGDPSFSNLAAGTYSTRAKLISSGCLSAIVNKVVTSPVPAAPTSAVTPTGCVGNSGTIVFSAPTPTSNYVFSIDNGVTFAAAGTTGFFNLAAGNYSTVSKLISTGCVSAAAVKTITKAVTGVPVSTVAATTSCITPNGAINFTGPTPLASYEFSIDSGATYHPAGNAAFSGLAAGSYPTFARSTPGGCVSTVVNKVVGSPAVTAPTTTIVNVTDCANPNGSITFNTPSAAFYVFSIDGGVTFLPPGQTSVSNLNAGVYKTVAKLVSSGCSSAIVNKTIAKPVNSGVDKAICAGQWVNMTATAAAGGSWTADPSNPSAVNIITPTSATTQIRGFKTPGTYNFTWSTATCDDIVSVIVSDCLSPIGCTNTAFLYQSGTNAPTDIIGVDISTGTQTTLYQNVTPGTTTINGIGYNVTDGHVWGSYFGAGQVARIGADGVPVYFTIPGLVGGNVGSIDNNGVLYVYTSNDTKIYRVDVNPASPTYLTLLSPVVNTVAIGIADWAFNPVDGFLYGVGGPTANVKNLYKIDTNTGFVTTLGIVTGPSAFVNGGFGANYFDALGNLYVGDNTAGGIYKISTVQNVIGNTTAVLRSQGQPSSNNDGALCQFACIKPDAGPDIDQICITAKAVMKATQVSGIGWSAQAGNPGTATITYPDSANTTIGGWSAPGKYNFIWTNGGSCNDTISVTVVDGCVVDSKEVTVTCPVAPIVICGTEGAAGHTPSTVYSLGALTVDDQTQGELTLDGNTGCAVWTANSDQTNAVYSFIVACNGTICDTTYIKINPPAEMCPPLPVKLISFKATNIEDASIQLTWVTASEENSQLFDVERSSDAKKWQTIKTVQAATNSASTLSYQTSDNAPLSGTSYYRLRMVDLDMSQAYSRIVSVEIGEVKSSVTVFPNPASSVLSLKVIDWSDVERIELISPTGTTVYSAKSKADMEINVKRFPVGMYVIRISRSNGVKSSHKVAIQR